MFSFIGALIHKTGLVGIGLLMLLENVFPVIPSELIMSLAGFESARGILNPIAVVAVGTMGSIIGGTGWYWLGWRLGPERLARWADHGGRWLPISPDDIRRGNAWFQRWGAAAVCIGRSLPGVRGLVCLPAGVARMPFWSFLLFSSIGALSWTTILTCAGYVLQAHYRQIEAWLNPVTDAFLILCAFVYVLRVVRYGRAGAASGG